MNFFNKIGAKLGAAGFRPVDGVVWLLFAAYVAFLIWQLSLPFEQMRLLPLLILSYFMLRIFYEFTFNRGRIPTLAAGLFDRMKIAALIQADCAKKAKAAYTVMDMGSGRGELTRHIARAVKSAKVVGIENSVLPFKQSQWLGRVLGFKNLEYRQADFFTVDCADADAVVLFLSAKITPMLGEKLWKELAPGALVISKEFELKGNWPTPQVVKLYTPLPSTMFVYGR